MGMPAYAVVTARAATQFRALSATVHTTSIPDFLGHDAAVARSWARLAERFPDYQFCLLEQTSGTAVARGHSTPLAFEGAWSSLPDGGFDWVLEQGFRDDADGRRPTVLSALYIVVADQYRGKGLSARVLAAMRQIGREQGFRHLIAPVRPSMKHHYPRIAMAEYGRWRNAAGDPFDPWLRVHVRAGGTVLHPCLRSMAVRGTLRQWEEWTGMGFPGVGRYVVPGALVPVTVEPGAEGVYVEPGIWVVHRLP
jgi:GNAT superfamily N-acetyltransferase